MKFKITPKKTTTDINAKIHLIYDQIDYELSKSSDEIDMDTVNELFKQIEKIDGGVYKKSKTELNIELSKIRCPKTRKKFPINKFIKKSVVGFSVACILLFSAFSFTALAVGGYSEAWYYISSSVHKILNLEPGNYEENGITIIKGEYHKKYTSIEELLQNEQLHILYPSQLPKDVKVEKIIQIDYENNLHEFVFAFSSNELNFSITNYNVNDLSNISYSIKNINNIDYYIFQDDNGMHHATFYYNDRQHNLTHKNYEELIYILKFMKGSL